MQLPSKLITNAVAQFSTLPGIGKRTALRLVLHLLKQSPQEVERFVSALTKMRSEVRFCENCHNISDQPCCSICSSSSRNHALVCVVEDIRDVIAIENTRQFFGIYHVLGGIISPIDGIGPADLNIDTLIEKVSKGEAREIVLALSATMEGDTTNFYLYKRLSPYNITLTTIARGVAVGDDLEYTDEVTLGRAIVHRRPYESVAGGVENGKRSATPGSSD